MDYLVNTNSIDLDNLDMYIKYPVTISFSEGEQEKPVKLVLTKIEVLPEELQGTIINDKVEKTYINNDLESSLKSNDYVTGDNVYIVNYCGIRLPKFYKVEIR